MKPIEKVAHDLDIFARDCAVTVALKITDDSCKMDEEQRAVFMALYDALPPYISAIFDEEVYLLIREARDTPTATLFTRIKKEREMAMAIITQEKMKTFKASVRGSLLIAELTR
ncbi:MULTISPECIES: hypothetical protein [unclassified Sulfuricurvum]|uniref:hypothetical protein n=1 Tax=unclassified Sulfuricurvum TaxID=2632390 RepID=UPI0002997BBE|nr:MULTISPECIES: hypothetical protein [unclassified Sulfuricurvum]AFV97662.1 hypothetical protein B649_06740 [Candidatus Sulfuricurvum sp. RIFRC-1]HBM36844.1 hypothetical protein [Sulfuricurvum sp.]